MTHDTETKIGKTSPVNSDDGSVTPSGNSTRSEPTASSSQHGYDDRQDSSNVRIEPVADPEFRIADDSEQNGIESSKNETRRIAPTSSITDKPGRITSASKSHSVTDPNSIIPGDTGFNSPVEGLDDTSQKKWNWRRLLPSISLTKVLFLFTPIIAFVTILIMAITSSGVKVAPTPGISETKEADLAGETFATFTTADGFDIRYMIAEPLTPKASVVLLPGRKETIETYVEAILRLKNANISVYAMDWRGQGGSSREFAESTRGHIDNFDLYGDDLHLFLEEIVKPHTRTDLVLFAVSMGGAIGMTYVLENPETFKAAIFSSPMWKLPITGFTRSAAYFLANTLGIFGADTTTLPGNTDYADTVMEYENNLITSSTFRYGRMLRQFEADPRLQTGGPTLRWIASALRSTERIERMLQENLVHTPIMVLSGDQDEVVDTQVNITYSREMKNSQLLRFASARHNILLEVDQVFNPAMRRIIRFVHSNMPVPFPVGIRWRSLSRDVPKSSPQ